MSQKTDSPLNDLLLEKRRILLGCVKNREDDDRLVDDLVHEDVVLVGNEFSRPFHSPLWSEKRKLLQLSCRLIEAVKHIAGGIHAFLRYVERDVIAILLGGF